MKKVRLFQLIILVFIIFVYVVAFYHPLNMISFFVTVSNTALAIAFIWASIENEINKSE